MYLVVHSGVTTERLNVKTMKLESTENKLKDVNLQVEQLKTQSSKDKEKQEQYKKQLEQKEKEKKELEAKLQAKLDAKAKLAAAATQAEHKLTATANASAASAPVTGSKADWMRAAGISPSDYTYVDYIVTKESGWNPNAVNPSSGACGLGQQLPCGKWAGAWNDPVAALVAMKGYAVARYGSWSGAYNFWISNNWW